MTVIELAKLCVAELKKGNGNKIIFISDDEEGNGYHDLIYGFGTNVKELDMWGAIADPDNAIILG